MNEPIYNPADLNVMINLTHTKPQRYCLSYNVTCLIFIVNFRTAATLRVHIITKYKILHVYYISHITGIIKRK